MDKNICVLYEEAVLFAQNILKAAGLPEKAATDTAYAICQASLRGTDSHGLRLLPHYLDVIEKQRIDAKAEFVFRRTGMATAILDANHGMAHAALMEAADHAVNLATEAGVGFVSVKNSNHCGAMAPFAMRICQHDMIGFAFTNATAKLRTYSSLEPFFGINPICMAAPMQEEEPFCFDAAPTIMSNNKVKIYAAEGKELPKNVAADADGRMTLFPSLAKMLIPLGADLAGYKGFGWAMMVDILCSLLSGMPNGKDVTSMYESDGGDLSQRRYLGQLICAIRIDSFEKPSVFKGRLQDTANKIRNQKVDIATGLPVMVPGDPEKKTAKTRLRTGIPVPISLVDSLNKKADYLAVPQVRLNKER